MNKMGLGGDGSRDDPWKGLGNQGLLEQGTKICSSFKSNELLKTQSNGKSRNKSAKFLEKESSKIQGVTNLPPLEKISSSRFGCSGNHCKHTVLRKLISFRVSFLPHIVPLVVSKIFWLRGFASPNPYSDLISFYINQILSFYILDPFLLTSILTSGDW